jgi:hypothetical protein
LASNTSRPFIKPGWRNHENLCSPGRPDVPGRLRHDDQHVLNDRYVILSTRREQYLLEYPYPCRDDPITQRPRPDIRRDARAIYADSDTFRGCPIGALYAITADQAEELKSIGEAPGE